MNNFFVLTMVQNLFFVIIAMCLIKQSEQTDFCNIYLLSSGSLSAPCTSSGSSTVFTVTDIPDRITLNQKTSLFIIVATSKQFTFGMYFYATSYSSWEPGSLFSFLFQLTNQATE